MNKDIFMAKVKGKLLSLKVCFYFQWVAEHVDYVWYINSDKMNSLFWIKRKILSYDSFFYLKFKMALWVVHMVCSKVFLNTN